MATEAFWPRGGLRGMAKFHTASECDRERMGSNPNLINLARAGPLMGEAKFADYLLGSLGRGASWQHQNRN